jgi:flagellar biosynthesis protein FlhB
MADQGQRTERPTKRKLDKSRSEGQFPASREMLAGLQFLAFVVLLSAGGTRFLERVRDAARYFLTAAFHLQLTPRLLFRLYRDSLAQVFVPLLWMGVCLTAVSLAAQLGSTRLGLSLKNLAPDAKRLSPLQKIQSVPRQNSAAFVQALVFLPLLALAVYKVESGNLAAFASLTRVGLGPALRIVSEAFRDFLWKAAVLFCAIGLLDFVRIYRRHYKSLRMTKLEVRDELRETEGNPQIKGRVRRIQRDLARRNMMKEIPNATAVIVNPTHFAVAIRYDMEDMAAPRVLAKGKNYLALRIRQIALDHQVPIVENEPLAQALYKSADVGQEIPPQLYQAVAEVLAYIYKLMQPRRR